MNNQGKSVVLIGASGGIGSAIAKVLDLDGCQILLVGRSAAKLHKLQTSLKGERHQVLVADLLNKDGIESLVEASKRRRASVLVNCLGVNQLTTLDDMSDGEVECLIHTNLIAPINVCRALLPHFKQLSTASIVNVGSALGSIGYAGSALYCASKFGLRGFTESLRRELADTRINVIYVAPRATNTDLNSAAVTAMNKALGNAVDSPERVAKLIAKAIAAEKSTNVYIGWPEKFFIRLNALFPSLVDKALAKQLATIKRYCGKPSLQQSAHTHVTASDV